MAGHAIAGRATRKTKRIRKALWVMQARGLLEKRGAYRAYGVQAALARHFGVTRQRINQLVREIDG